MFDTDGGDLMHDAGIPRLALAMPRLCICWCVLAIRLIRIRSIAEMPNVLSP